MSFREKVVEIEYPNIPGPVDPQPEEIKTEDRVMDDQDRLDVWELEKGHRYAGDYFGLREIMAGDKIVKMKVHQIDNYIKEKMEQNGMEKTITNYKALLAELEGDIDSTGLIASNRIEKIIGYINVLKKLSALKEIRDKYRGF